MELGNQCFKHFSLKEKKKNHETPATEVSIDSNLNFPTSFIVWGLANDFDI